MDAKTLARFWSKVNRNGPLLREDLGCCWVWTASRHVLGYGDFRYDGRVHRAHRIAWLITHGSFPDACALHKCDGGSVGCVRPDHLFEGTQADNMQDRLTKGRYVGSPGESNGRARLTEKSVREIRALAASGASYRKMAIRFGISSVQVRNVVQRISWQHLL